MNRKTRYFMLGSFTVLIVGLCAGLVAYYGGLPAGLTAKEAPGLPSSRTCRLGRSSWPTPTSTAS